MASNPYSLINGIVNYKRQWHDYDSAGNTVERDKAAAGAQPLYQQLRELDNGAYAYVADALEKSNYHQSKTLNDTWAKKLNVAKDYDKSSDINSIYNLKGDWQTAYEAGDEQGMKDAEQKAKYFYDNLRNYGFNDIADYLSSANYEQSKAINNQYLVDGKTSTRLFYDLGAKYGLSTDEINKLVDWDPFTGELMFGGKKIGKADAVVEGIPYFSDSSVLEKAFSDYIARTGTTRDKALAVNQENENVFKKWNEAYDYAMNTNPFTTKEAQAILGKYSLAGLQARDNAAASGGASNGGNIDSYSAANAMRQQASLINQGQTAVLDAHQQKIDNIRNILSEMGVNIDRVFNQDETTKAREFEQGETAKNNEVARWQMESEITGTVPTALTYKDNIYLNDDGTVRKEFLTEEFDSTGGFATIIDDIKAKLKTTTDPEERAKLNTQLYFANQAMAFKIYGDPKYAQFAHKILNLTPPQTVSDKQFNQQMESVDKQLKSQETVAETNAKATVDSTKLETDAALKNTEMQINNDNDKLQSQLSTATESMWQAVNSYFDVNGSGAGPMKFVEDVLKKQNSISNLKQLLLDNTAKYNLDIDECKYICTVYQFPTDWLDDYRDRTDKDGDVESYTGKKVKGQYGGIVKK